MHAYAHAHIYDHQRKQIFTELTEDVTHIYMYFREVSLQLFQPWKIFHKACAVVQGEGEVGVRFNLANCEKHARWI